MPLAVITDSTPVALTPAKDPPGATPVMSIVSPMVKPAMPANAGAAPENDSVAPLPSNVKGTALNDTAAGDLQVAASLENHAALAQGAAALKLERSAGLDDELAIAGVGCVVNRDGGAVLDRWRCR